MVIVDDVVKVWRRVIDLAKGTLPLLSFLLLTSMQMACPVRVYVNDAG